jgi:hypothetical protein
MGRMINEMHPDYTNLTPELKEQIDALTHIEMCRLWRFAESGSIYFMFEVGDYFKKRLYDHFGGFTPEISKAIGH